MCICLSIQNQNVFLLLLFCYSNRNLFYLNVLIEIGGRLKGKNTQQNRQHNEIEKKSIENKVFFLQTTSIR